MEYPTFNWWRGCVRRYESSLSVFLRFCELNRISVKRAEGILPIRPHQPYRSPDEEAERLAGVLDEPISVVRTMFLPCLNLGCAGGYSLTFNLKEKFETVIRFCPECARCGYHSVFHEAAWLEMCPFHAMPLQVAPPIDYGRILDMRISVIRRVMRAHCANWPLVTAGPIDRGNDNIAKSILDWAECTNAAGRRFAEMDFFVFNYNASYNRSSFLRRLGQLCEISPPSVAVKAYMKNVEGEWSREYAMLSNTLFFKCSKDYARTVLSILFDFYVRTQVLSPTPPMFVVRYRDAVRKLRNEHEICRCKWVGVTSANGLISWRICGSSGRKTGERCPYEIALAELDGRWGNWREVDGERRVKQEIGRLIAIAQDLRDFRLVKLKSDRAANREEYFEQLNDLLGNYTWEVDASVIGTLDAAAIWQIDAEVRELNYWLSRIDGDSMPSTFGVLGASVHLQECNAGMQLMRWIFWHPSSAIKSLPLS